MVYLALTDLGGRTLATALAHHLESLERRVASRISPEDTATFNRVLDELRTAPD